jgi:hypothetical protein
MGATENEGQPFDFDPHYPEKEFFPSTLSITSSAVAQKFPPSLKLRRTGWRDRPRLFP